jgi:hypothetical protein
MSCDVSLGDYDGDEAQFYSAREVLARKAHICYECREPIQPGMRYERIAGKWEGEVRTYCFCLACSEIQREFAEHGRTFGNTWDEFENAWMSGANLQACMNRVQTVAAKEKLRQQWLKYKGLAQ